MLWYNNYTTTTKKIDFRYLIYNIFNQHWIMFTDVVPVINALNTTCRRVSDVLINGKSTSHMATPEDSER